MSKIGIAFILAALSACHRPAAPATRVAGVRVPVTAIRGGDVRQFVAAVPPIDSGAACRPVVQLPGTPPGQRTFVMRYGSDVRHSRSVAVTVNAAGVPIRYSDGRGDLRAPFDRSVTADAPLGARTSIAIDLRDSTAMLNNERTGKALAVMRVYGAAILTAENLDVPSRQIARVLAACAAPDKTPGAVVRDSAR